MPDQQPPPPPPRRPPTAALAPSNSSSPMLLSASSSASSTSLLRSRALAKVKSAAHSTSDYVSPKLETAATKVRNYKANATTSSSWDRNDDPGILTTPKKVQKSRQQQHQGSMSEFDAMLLRGSALPSPSLSSSDQQQQKASRWGGIGSYFTGNSSMSSSSSSMSGSSSSGTMKPPLAQDLEKEKIVCFPGWATLQPARNDSTEPALTLDILVHGYAYRSRPLSHASRSQRIFYALAKSFASLPKIPPHLAASVGLDTSSSMMGSQSVDSLSIDLKETALQEGNVFEKLLEVGGREDDSAPQRQELVEAIVEPGSPTTTEPEEMSIDERLRSPTTSSFSNRRDDSLSTSSFALSDPPPPKRELSRNPQHASTAPPTSQSSVVSPTLSQSPEDEKILPTPAKLSRKPHVRIDIPSRRANGGGPHSASIRSPSLPPTPGATSPPATDSPSSRSGGGGGFFSKSHSRKSTASSITSSSRPSSRASSRANSRASSPTRTGTSTTNPSSHHKDSNSEWPLPFTYTETDLPRLHANLSERILPFFGAKLPTRKVRLSVYPSLGEGRLFDGKLATKVISTTSPGAGFRTTVQVSGNGLKKFLESTAMNGDRGGLEGMRVRIVAELLEPDQQNGESVGGAGGGGVNATNGRSIGGTDLLRVTAEDEVELPVGIESAGGGIRVISDVDDTIKWTEVVKGTKTIFRNVFVRELHEIRVPGMAPWYQKMSSIGAQFHYVSNSPWELWPVVRAFMEAAGFPKGSCTLKEYGGASSAIAKLWEEPGQRKRANVEVLLKEFPDSRFILVGDSGEQDMQLYVSLAAQYPQNVLGIFIRDVTTPFRTPSSPAVSGTSSPRPGESTNTTARTTPKSSTSFPPPEVTWQHSHSASDLAGLVREEEHEGGDHYRSTPSRGFTDIPDIPGQFTGSQHDPVPYKVWKSSKTDSSTATSNVEDDSKASLPPRPSLAPRSHSSSQTVTLDSTPPSPSLTSSSSAFDTQSLSNSTEGIPSVFLSDQDSDPLSPNNPIRSSTIGPNTAKDVAARLQAEQVIIEGFYKKVAQCEKELPKGIPLRLFRHGQECVQEALDLINNSSKRRP